MKLNKEQKICLAFIIFGVCALLILFGIQYVSTKSIIKLNGVELRTQDYNSIQEKFGNYVGTRVCDLDSKKCILLTNIDNYKELKGIIG